MPLHRRNVLLGLFGLSLPFIASSCTQNSPQASSSSANVAQSSETSSSEQAPAKIRVGCQVYAGSEILEKGLGLAKQTFANTEVEYLRFDSGRDANTAFAANSIDFGVLGSAAAAVELSRNLPYSVFYVYELTDTAEALRQAGSLTWFDASEQVDAKNLDTAGKPGEIITTLKRTADFMVSQKAIPSAPAQDAIQKHIYHAL